MTRWVPAAVVVLGVLALAWSGLAVGQPSALVAALAGLGIAWWVSPLNGRSGPRHTDVLADPSAHPVVIYWRPGCIFCTRLRGALGKAKDEATWVSIWADDEAAAWVRSVNGGDETVPTVRIGERVHTNPDPEIVRAALH